MSGLVELLFILLIAIGWGVWELRSLRQPPKKPLSKAAPPPGVADRTEPPSSA